MTPNKNKKPSKPETLVKPAKKGSIQLSEKDLDKVSGGVRKAGKDQTEY